MTYHSDAPQPTIEEAAGQLEDGLRMGTEWHAQTELGEFVRWLVDYVEKPIDTTLIRQAEQKDLSVKTLLSLGYGTALTAVTGKVQEILRAKR